MKSRMCGVVAAFVLLLLLTPAPAALQSFITMQDGYFYDSGAGQPWVPHGIAYQTWNRPLGVWQTTNQIDYDLDEMVKMGANSIRVDFVWKHIEESGDNVWSWTNYDYLLAACNKRNIRVFALIGYQWPPDWFQDAWYTMHPPGRDSEGILHTNRWQSDIINYEHPTAQAQYSNFIYNVCYRYRTNKAVVGWIVGNEYGYLGLWSLKFDGYDANCEGAFRTWCSGRYGTIASLNAAWGSAYTNFNQILFVNEYSWKGTNGAEWADMVQWREDSIAKFTAIGARAARAADTNHLLSYSTVGMQWGEEDHRYHAEDRGKIARACASNNAALAFFSVNNYPWAMDGSETRNGQWGISFTKKTAGIPVLYTETGFTSSETLFPGINEQRQGGLIRNALWESLEAGAIGTHIFSWMDRPWITDREKGFGIVYADRNIKPAFWASRDAFNLMEQARMANLLKGSADPKPDVAFLWDEATDSQYIRFENEMQHEAGALERLGFEPSFILGLGELTSGAYTNYKAIILPRNMRVSDTVPGYTNSLLNFLLTQVIPKGIHVIAVADVPGMQDRYGKPRAAFSNEVSRLFGIDASSVGGWQPAGTMEDSILWQYFHKVNVQYNTNPPASLRNYACSPAVWKYSDSVRVGDGTLWAKMDTLTNMGYEASTSWVPGWNTWGSNVVRRWGWQYEGSNMVQMWGWAGQWRDFQVIPGQKYTHNAYLRNNSDDGLSNGTFGVVTIEWYDKNTNLIGSAIESPRLTAANNTWQYFSVSAVAPSNVAFGRMIRKLDRATNAPIGSLYVDADTWLPAVVAKNHGTAKAVILLHSLDMLPDGSGDGEPDNLPYRWRSDILGSILKDYCGVQPAIQATGTNAYLCLPEYRTCTNGAVLIQVKNYLYDRFQPNGGAPQTFTIQSSLLNGKTVRAFEQGRIIEQNSDGIVSVTLQPDGHEVLYAYTQGTNAPQIVQIADAPSVVHPFGDKVYQVRVKFDCAGATGLKLKAAFMEDGNNGDAVSNEVYSILTNLVTGAGESNFYMWIPDWSQTDTDYKSTPDGGKYVFAAWLENGSGVRIAQALPLPTSLEWGLRPTNSLPTALTKGQAVSIPIEWEDLYEQLFWQNTPIARNGSFPSRVAVFRSSKTEAQFAGHLAKVDQICTWLGSLGYSSGNLLDVLFDNVTIGTFVDNFEDGNYTGWTRAAGCGNWAVSTSPTATTLGVVGYWKCDETAWSGVSNDVRDSSGKANHGRAFNGAQTTNDAKLGRAGWFDGTNDYVEITNSATLQANSNLTLSFWIKARNLGAGRINPLDKSYGGEFALTIETNRAMTYYHGKARVSGQYYSWTALPANSLTNNAWQHVVITRDAKNRALRSYINGVLKSSTTYTVTTNNTPTASTYPVRLGQGYTAFSLGGVLDDVKVVTNAWTANEVASEYRVGLGTKSLRAWRIGNSDNIMTYANTYTNVTISADIRYNKQDNYFNDAEVLFRYQNRDNFYKVGIRNYYGFWRLRYMVRARTNIAQQGWICDFPKTNRPAENIWYNLKIESYGSTNKVYFNGQLVGTFWATNFASGKVGVGSSAMQMGVWEPQKGYYFIDDDEYSFWAPEGQAPLYGRPLNLDWGYLKGYFNTLILPGVYVMSDLEASNICTWVTNGLNSLIATDGSTAMRNEAGAADLGRIERLFGVAASVTTVSNVNRVVLGTNDHYVTLDYGGGQQFTASGLARPWNSVTTAKRLATVFKTNEPAPALLANMITNNAGAPAKAFCFNFAADTGSQLTGALSTIAKRAFEWCRGQAFKARLELKYQVNPAWPNSDIIVAVTNGWILTGSGTATLVVGIPTDGIMTGNKLYWSGYIYPWDAADPWAGHAGFFSTANDGVFVTIPGKGLQIQGITANAYAGRAWDMWTAYNTTGQASMAVFGIKDRGAVQDEDNFNDGNYTGWNVTPHANIAWSVTNGALRASVVSTGGYSYIERNNLGLQTTNVTFEYSTRFMNGARHGGLLYRGRVCYVNPQMCGWADNSPLYYTNNTGVTTGKWQYVVLHVRDGAPYMRSDLYVDGKVVFLDEAIEVTNWTTNTVGFLSPYTSGYVEWDDTRVADEQYTFVTQAVNGVFVSTNGAVFNPFIPDYDAARWEHEGTTLGAEYQWYVYLRGDGIHSYSNVNVYFAPRLRVEATNFPTVLTRGQVAQVPVEWENLPAVPARMRVQLQDAWSGIIYATNTFVVSNATSSGLCAVTIPSNTPSGAGYLWGAYIYPTNAIDPWVERIGADDTFRHGPDGIGVEPETTVTVSAAAGNTYTVYSDLGIPSGSSIFTWQGGAAYFNGDYTGITPPEGTKCFMTTGNYWQGWGVFRSATDMRTYSNGYVKFWARCATTIKIDLEGPQYTKRTQYIGTTTNTWREFSLPVSGFSGVVLTNMYGLFEATAEVPATFYIDNVRWSQVP